MNNPESSCLRVLDAEGEDGDAWRRIWSSAADRDIFWHPDYCRLFSSSDGRARCAVLSLGGGHLVFPFIQRDLSRLPYWSPDLGVHFDITSPYGYGGPYYSGPDAGAISFAPLWHAFGAWAESTGVVSEFVRFSLSAGSVSGYHGVVVPKGKNVVRTLELDDQAVWTGFEHKVRKNVRKALQSGVTVEIASEPARLDEFLRIYHSTLTRRSANDAYFFDRHFLEALNRVAPGTVAYAHALVDGRVVSTELVLVSDTSVYSFLGGTDQSSFPLRPNDLLKFELIKWASHNKKQRFVMGGGYRPEDGIFKYKKSFAPHGVVEFHVGHKIYNLAAYGQLTQRSRARAGGGGAPSTEYFPAYRAPVVNEEDEVTA